ncbi:MAG: hypothetical protein JHC84_04390 [Solirubrobacteraceae bacterium]|nr:hypothetical protein [Solirubrobacteraceae bacterium]
MLPRKQTVIAPDGVTWEVSIDWTRNPVKIPHAWRRDGRDGPDMGDAFFVDFSDGVVAAIVAALLVAVFILVVWLVVWPLLAIAIEVVLLSLIAIGGTAARLFFRRHWVIEAIGSGGQELRWRTKGRAGAYTTVDQVAEALRGGLTPQPAAAELAQKR